MCTCTAAATLRPDDAPTKKPSSWSSLKVYGQTGEQNGNIDTWKKTGNSLTAHNTRLRAFPQQTKWLVILSTCNCLTPWTQGILWCLEVSQISLQRLGNVLDILQPCTFGATHKHTTDVHTANVHKCMLMDIRINTKHGPRQSLHPETWQRWIMDSYHVMMVHKKFLWHGTCFIELYVLLGNGTINVI